MLGDGHPHPLEPFRLRGLSDPETQEALKKPAPPIIDEDGIGSHDPFDPIELFAYYTGLTVNQGDRVAFNASGQIQWGQNATQTATPDGHPAERRATYPDPTVPVGALLGKIGNSAPFGIGMQTQPLVMPASGRLMLGINDNELGDNSGFFSVVVAKQ